MKHRTTTESTTERRSAEQINAAAAEMEQRFPNAESKVTPLAMKYMEASKGHELIAAVLALGMTFGAAMEELAPMIPGDNRELRDLLDRLGDFIVEGMIKYEIVLSTEEGAPRV